MRTKAPWTRLRRYRKREEKKKPYRVPSISASQRRRKQEYYRLLNQLYGNPRRVICCYPGCTCVMEDNHHTRGKSNQMLFEVKWFAGLCRTHHDLVRDQPEMARGVIVTNPLGEKIPLLCPKGKWNHDE